MADPHPLYGFVNDWIAHHRSLYSQRDQAGSSDTGNDKKIRYYAVDLSNPAKEKIVKRHWQRFRIQGKTARITFEDLEALGKEGITSVLIEGGGQINTSALDARIVDKVVFFYAPCILGGTKAPMIVGGKGVSKVEDGLRLDGVKTRRFGDDVMIEGYL